MYIYLELYTIELPTTPISLSTLMRTSSSFPLYRNNCGKSAKLTRSDFFVAKCRPKKVHTNFRSRFIEFFSSKVLDFIGGRALGARTAIVQP